MNPPGNDGDQPAQEIRAKAPNAVRKRILTGDRSLRDLQAQARRHLDGIRADNPARAGTGGRKRPRRRRVLLWCIELAVFLAVLEWALLAPRRAASDRADNELVHPAVPAGDPLPALGNKAIVLTGLGEPRLQLLATVNGLAPGSETMRQTQRSFSREHGLPIEVVNSIGMRFRLVPPGTALIGSPPNEPGRGETERQHVGVIPRPFYLGTFEVTQRQWSRLMPNNPSAFSGLDHPVEEVTWYDCQRFVNALSKHENVPPGTYRLPTEVEWEYACRAGTGTAYYSGDAPADLDRIAEYAGNNYESTRPVGGKQPNALGIFNMHGNVWEWCHNRFAPYPGDETPVQPEYREWRCIRGGNWYVPAEDCRSAERSRLPAPSHGNMLGFRVLRSIPEFEMQDDSQPPAPSR